VNKNLNKLVLGGVKKNTSPLEEFLLFSLKVNVDKIIVRIYFERN
tara:strand:+ start:931 stop:1065 length:135 start_codon:yes stop_codon:yes gene_type:complete